VTNPTTISFLRRGRGVSKRDMFQGASVRLDAAAVKAEPQTHSSDFLVIVRDPSTHVALMHKGLYATTEESVMPGKTACCSCVLSQHHVLHELFLFPEIPRTYVRTVSLIIARNAWQVMFGPKRDQVSGDWRVGIGSFPGVKLPGRGADHPPSSSADVRERDSL
jgi:hypothetical protein